MRFRYVLIVFLFTLIDMQVIAQGAGQEVPLRKNYIGSSLFVLMTPLLSPSPEFYQLNYGYRLSPRDVLSFEAITWSYLGPLGRPYGPDYEKEETDYPGSVSAYGAGLAYKRFVWKRLFAQAHVTAFHQNYLDVNDKKLSTGFQLFSVLRIGYQVEFLRGRVFIEPSIAATSWPINSNLPESFQVEEDKWNKYFLFEPGMHFGISF